MRFDALSLNAFGPYTNRRLVFEGSFSLVYGPNEAGKSSLLRAVTALMFGFPERTLDNFLHDSSQLRVGASLSRRDGQQLTLLRRKGHKATLLDVDGQTLDDGLLRSFCGPLDEQLFSSIFCLDHQRLRQGGSNIISGGGEVGQSLFEAGTGLLGLRTTLQHLEEEARKLFLPRGTTQPVNRAIRRHTEARARIKEHMLRGDEWRRLQQEVEAARDAVGTCSMALQDTRHRVERLARIKRNQPLIVRYLANKAELEQLALVPDLAGDAAERRIHTVADLQSAQNRGVEVTANLLQLREQLQGLMVDERLLDQAAPVEAVFKATGAWQEASQDLPQRIARRDQYRTLAQVKLQAIRPGLVLEDAEGLRLTSQQISRLRDLIREQARLQTMLEGTQTALQELEESLAVDRDRLMRLPTAVDLLPMTAALEAARSRGDVEQRHRQAQEQWQALRRQLESLSASLSWWHGTPAEFERLPFPTRESIERAEQERLELQAEARQHDQEQKRLTAEIDKLEAERAALEATGEVATIARLKALRDRRDEGWRWIQDAYVERKTPVQEAQDRYAEGGSVPQAFERAVLEADRVVDELRADTQRVTEFASLSRRLLRLKTEQSRQDETRGALQRRLTYCEEGWQRLWEGTGIVPAAPRECLAWHARREEILRLLRECAQLESSGHLLAQDLQEGRQAVQQALLDLGQASARDGDGLRVLVLRTQALQEELSRQNRQREDLATRVADREATRAASVQRLEAAVRRMASWQAAWSEAVAPLAFPAIVSPSEVEGVLNTQEELYTALGRLHEEQRRIDGMSQRLHSYAARVQGLVASLAPELAPLAADEAADTLYRRLGQARRASQQRDALQEQVLQKQAVLESEQRKVLACQADIERLCQAGACTLDELPQVEVRSARKRRLQSEVQDAESQLTEQNSMPLERVLEEGAQEDRDTLPGRLELLGEKLASLDQDKQSLTARYVAKDLELKHMDGSDRAATAAQEAQEALAELRDAGDSYLRLQASVFLLRKTIEDYRERHQGPLLRRAAEIFPVLTEGSFSSLRTTFDDKDKLILVGVRPDGREVTVDGMSDGTVDQLYLALRLSAIERHVHSSEPLPLVLDDILIHFDDDRARATLPVLEQISRQTQVLFFTHHQHLVDLAVETIGRDRLQIVRLNDDAPPRPMPARPLQMAIPA